MSNHTHYYKIVVNEYETHMATNHFGYKDQNSQSLPAGPLYKAFKNFVVLPLPDILEFNLTTWMQICTCPVLTELDSFVSYLSSVTLLC